MSILERLTLLTGLVVLVAAAGPARAALGDGVGGVESDRLALAGTRQVQNLAVGELHLIRLADGATVREYLTPAGRVYAVAWNLHGKPRLDRLLGTYFGAYARGAQQALAAQPGVHHSAQIDDGELVVESTAHLNAFVGRAYLRSQLPPATNPDAIR